MIKRLLWFLVLALTARAEKINLVWPTPNKAFLEGRGIEAFVQPTASGQVESGLFGCRRSGGAQFHEGLDLKPVTRDRKGEATDPIFAAMDGIVRHISRVAGNSNYGRYIVLEHPGVTPAVYTLYAHLAAVEPGLAPGQTVKAGQVLGTMGRSASGNAIPRDRAHLHFEIGVALTRNFQFWYNSRKFGSPNDHGMWNGMNLAGIDPLEFFTRWRDGRVSNFEEHFRAEPVAVTVRVFKKSIPDYVDRYPFFLSKPLPADGGIGGWEVAFNGFGVPVGFTPLTPIEAAGKPANTVEVVDADAALLAKCRCKHLAVRKGTGWRLARDLQNNVELLFGLTLR